MKYKRKYVIYVILLDVAFVLVFVFCLVSSLINTFSTGVNYVLRLDSYKPMLYFFNFGLAPFVHVSFKRLFLPLLSIQNNLLIVRKGFKDLKINLESIKRIEIDKTFYLYYLNSDQVENGTYLEIEDNEFSILVNELQSLNKNIQVKDLRDKQES